MNTNKAGMAASSEDSPGQDHNPGTSYAGEIQASIKAGLIGGIAVLILYLLSRLPLGYLMCLIAPLFIISWGGTGLMAAMMSRQVTSKGGLRSGCSAGFISGIVGGLGGMIVATTGSTFKVFGNGVVAQFTDSQLSALANAGLDAHIINQAGSVIGALFACGIVGGAMAAAIGAAGGWLYTKIK